MLNRILSQAKSDEQSQVCLPRKRGQARDLQNQWLFSETAEREARLKTLRASGCLLVLVVKERPV